MSTTQSTMNDWLYWAREIGSQSGAIAAENAASTIPESEVPEVLAVLRRGDYDAINVKPPTRWDFDSGDTDWLVEAATGYIYVAPEVREQLVVTWEEAASRCFYRDLEASLEDDAQ